MKRYDPSTGHQVHTHIVLSELGIKKSKDMDMKPTEVKDIMVPAPCLVRYNAALLLNCPTFAAPAQEHMEG
ncbi:MAG: hypothetical protein M8349_06385 [ANME-2 cluster archaeon]|nr:hypothetical protein [ANME-2 cluster archaeon]MDF1558176.1 hypothetical protein [ANME-2 cluster archaeon]